ncbi:hypothetical protein NST34_11975 [Paenibacillus sp. FSL H7-0714]|uniref:hypothetical protein n=1 Tax=Paenibacillus sp. FSL H7-0714 TaxID=2954735 RepID=UPI0030F55A74
MLFHLWTKHDLRPGAFWSLPKGEQLLLRAFTERELEIISKAPPGMPAMPSGRRGRRVTNG